MSGRVYDFGECCPKCKGADPLRVYCKGCKLGAGEEHHDVLCLKCGYSWAQRTADARRAREKKDKEPKGGTDVK